MNRRECNQTAKEHKHVIEFPITRMRHAGKKGKRKKVEFGIG